MDYDRLALFLSTCTTLGFRRSLGATPLDTLHEIGFHPGEAALLNGSLTKHHTGGKGLHHEGLLVDYTFQQITKSGSGKSSFKDSWVAVP